jgi:hypothetical protein
VEDLKAAQYADSTQALHGWEVVGGGVPEEWLGEPMSVRGLPTSLGGVDWSWREGKMTVTVRGRRPGVRLGPAWGEDTRVEVHTDARPA